MKITSLSVEGAGRFGSRVSVKGFGDGVNILAAGNEAGKSTLFRVMRACLFERHSTSNRSVMALSTEGISLPLSVSLGFTHGGHEYRLDKCFARSESASLTRDSAVVAKGRQADEEAWEVLGINPGSGRSVDEAAFGLLWVGQGKSFGRPKLEGAAADTLKSIVHEEVGALVGGERARHVLERIGGELDQQLTPGKKPKAGSPLAHAFARVRSLGEELEAAERRLRMAEDHLANLEQKTRERASLADSTIAERMKADLQAARQDLDVTRKRRAALSKAELEAAQAKAPYDSSLRAMAELEGCAARIDESRARDQEAESKLAPFEAQAAIAREKLHKARTAKEHAQVAAQEVDAEARALALLKTAAENKDRRAELASRQQSLQRIADRLGPIEAELGANKATAELVEALGEIERQLAVIDARLEASAAVISIEPGKGGAGLVRLDGEAVNAPESRALTNALTISVGDLATIKASPPAGYGKTDIAKREELEAKLSNVLEEGGALSADQLRTQHARRRDFESQAAAIGAELKAFGVPRPTLAPQIERLRADIAAIDESVESILGATGRSELPLSDELTEAVGDLDERRVKLRSDVARLDAEIEQQSDDLRHADTEVGALKASLVEIRNSQAGDLALLPDEARTEKLDAARRARDEAKATYDKTVDVLGLLSEITPDEAEIERLQSRCTRLEEAIAQNSEMRARLDSEIAHLEGQISSIGADGVGEKAAALQADLELSEREAQRLQSRVDMLQLLSETVDACYREQREHLNAPLIRHLQPFFNDLFSSAVPEFGDDFSVTGIRRGSTIAERFDMLSDGTQEQIAVLVRLAMGSMISERGEPVPVILDDALAFSDDDRIERMFDALNRAGQRHQVIVLTCRLRAFASLGGRQLAIEAG